MIRGLGTDIVEISRVARLVEKISFTKKIYTPKEWEYILSKKKNAAESAAGFFCAKEAVVKAIGSGFGGEWALTDIEIYHDEKGKPQVHILKQNSDYRFMLSISHCREYATATAIWL